MKLASVNYRGKEEAVVIYPEGAVPVSVIGDYVGSTWPGSLLRIIKEGRLNEVKRWFEADQGKAVCDLQKEIIPFAEVRYSPLYRRPPKIIGVGLNYPEHIVNLKEREPEIYPGTFIKPATSIIGYGDKIMIPDISERTTAEAELGIVIGKKAKNVSKKDWLKVVAGFTSIIDVTAEDILSLNPRFLTLAKGFDSFFSFGPFLLTPDEVLPLESQRISTVINGKVIAENIVSNMIYPPDHLVSIFSEIFTLLPGDVISTGTPGAGVISNGDAVEAKLTGFSSLKNYVIDLKNKE